MTDQPLSETQQEERVKEVGASYDAGYTRGTDDAEVIRLRKVVENIASLPAQPDEVPSGCGDGDYRRGWADAMAETRLALAVHPEASDE